MMANPAMGRTRSLFRGTVAACSVVFAATLTSFAFDGDAKSVSASLYFVFPILWILWICCAIALRREHAGFRLFLIWLLIDLSVLVTYDSFASPGVSTSDGVDIVTFIVYFPVHLPVVFVPGVGRVGGMLYRLVEPHSTMAEVFKIWIEPSFYAAVQCTVIFWLVRSLRGERVRLPLR